MLLLFLSAFDCNAYTIIKVYLTGGAGLKKIKIFKAIRHISLRDKCLIIFMITFILQSASTLFFSCGGEYATNIDIVARTTMASIFGYFISSNFISCEESEKNASEYPKAKKKIKYKIQEIEEIESKNNTEQRKDNNIQILIVTSIGLASLFILFFAREVIDVPQDALATISQFRSFVSGCVGFLIGISPEKK